MRIETRELRPSHKITVFVVTKWHPIYRYFNRLFARASRRHEYAITDLAFWTRYDVVHPRVVPKL